MSYTNELIDRYKIAIKVDSDYAVAKALGLRPNRISNYRTGISHADDKTAVMLATVLHLDPMETIARINMDRASDKEDKAFWRRFAGTTAIVLCAIGFSLPATGNAYTARVSTENTQSVSSEQCLLCKSTTDVADTRPQRPAIPAAHAPPATPAPVPGVRTSRPC